jgi:CCR4-NOT transcriptional complex subunit CAF120
MPKSQSMGFGNPRQSQLGNGNVPETHPYRGFLNAQHEKSENGQGGQAGMPRSSSMPLEQAARNGNVNGSARSTPPVEKETMSGSPSLGSTRSGDGTSQSWIKQFDAVVDLIAAQPQKTYVASPPELEMILARTSAGGQPK